MGKLAKFAASSQQKTDMGTHSETRAQAPWHADSVAEDIAEDVDPLTNVGAICDQVSVTI